MNKHTIENVFKANNSKTETAMDTTTRVVREIVDEEAEQRQAKINRLRHTRLEREAKTPPVTKASAASKSHRTKAASTQ